MSCVKYLCIDDQTAELITPVLTRLSDSGAEIKFERQHPEELELLYGRIKFELSERVPFGMLVDLRLDERKDDDGKKVFYRGPTLAQDLRTRMAEGDLENFPIVLWSMNEYINRYYDPDNSSHDLFDEVYVKDGPDSVSDDAVAKRAAQLVSLSCGYDLLNSCIRSGAIPDFEKALDLPGGEIELIDPRLIQYLSVNVPYIFAGKVLNSLIRSEGVLISELMLAAKLGVDRELSGDAWNELLHVLQSCEYSGVFHQGWRRWWWHRVSDFWGDVSGTISSLRKYGAEERVRILNDKLKLSLVAARPMCDGYSDRFSTLCVATQKPIDTIDAFKVVRSVQGSWQDSYYVSADAAIKREKRGTWKLDPLEFDRYRELMDSLKNGE